VLPRPPIWISGAYLKATSKERGREGRGGRGGEGRGKKER